MDLREKCRVITAKMASIDYEKIWPGFHQYKIALYDDNHVCYQGKILPKTNEFIANTSIRYQNEMIGIWKLQEDLDDNILASKLIHETFHAFQADNHESRYPDELKALLKYNYNSNNLSLKLVENKLIVELVDSFDKSVFRKLINLRQYRLGSYPDDVLYETQIEQIEGSANYVELESLRQLNHDQYMKKLNQMKQALLKTDRLIPIRVISYEVGALLIKVMVDNEIPFNSSFNDSYYLDCSLKPSDHIDLEIREADQISELVERYLQETRSLLDNSLKEVNLVAKGRFKLIGVNIYNARYLDNHIITEYFLMYQDGDEEVLLNGDYVVKVNDELIVSAVYRLIR